MKTITTICIYLLVTTAFLYAGPLKVGLMLGHSGLGDQSVNDLMYSGLAKAQVEHGIEIIIEQPFGTSDSREKTIQRLIKKGASVIVANSFRYGDAVIKSANKYPNVFFIQNDRPIDGIPNVVSLIYGQHEGSFLAGTFAALMSKSKKIGFIGGLDMPVIQSFRTGFVEGALYADSNMKVVEKFVARNKDYSGFRNPELANKLAKDIYAQGADIIFVAAGMSGNGVIQAASETKNFAIGVDVDQDHMAPGYVLTSMMKRIDIAAYNEISNIIRGNFSSGIKRYDLKQGGVSLTEMTYTKKLIPQKVLKRLNETKNKMSVT